MQDVITIGKRVIPVEQIAFVEPFDPASNPEFKSDKPYRARVVLLNRETVLTEETPQAFADARGFRLLAGDNMAVNPALAFRVETFTPSETFKPNKPYVTRLKWRDGEGSEHSKLLLSPPETVIAVVVRGDDEQRPTVKGMRRPSRARAQRRGSRKLELARA